MSLVYQTNAAASSKTSGSTQSTAAQSKGSASETGGEFLQTLAQSLAGGGGTNEGTNGATKISAPLMFTFASNNEGKNASITDTLNSLFVDTGSSNLVEKLGKLFGDLDKLDEALENDPTLLAGLQSLIQQLYALLNKDADGNQQTSLSGVTANADQAAKSVSAVDLSQHPAAVRFVLQDVLTQLATAVLKLDSNVVKRAPEFQQLLQQLQSQLKEVGVETDGKKGWSDLKSVLDRFSAIKDGSVQTPSTTPTTMPKTETMTPQMTVSSGVQESKASSMNVKADSIPVTDAEPVIHQSNIITAGELSLRSSGTVVSKPAEPVMQATNFAKEMTQFVVSKLDIVNQKGFSEATISLRPEHLGKLDVQITLQNGQLVARFVTEHVMAKDMLEQQMMQLRSSLQSQGIQVERLEVTQNSSFGSEMYQDGGRQQGNQSQQQRRSRERGEHTDEAVTAAGLQEELRNWRSEQVEGNEIQRDSFSAEA
ncbi:flagellar hook-length control protein FliK [Paenibacillus polysaccharolyticus]|uniref:flagellar hook-length control protein FliK n=1 Tax=Paenibacillus polysaccharolyticus TaxID=582692 RepID=UPI00203FF874|nr:flagellar hook-length control protein FliK [Paenibacillus polysaccharolyticus]MCM3131983.1 flagellar hook-length control protein FliK [Paenibacillus polysaccharolyticus]